MTEMPRMNAPNADAGRLVQAVSEALTDSMVERLSITGANALEVVDRLNDETTRDAVMAVLDGLTQMHKSGALTTLIDSVMLIHAVRSAATDSMVERAFAFVEHMASNLATEELATLAHETKGALEDAVTECAKAPSGGGGIMNTLKMLGRPETQQALQFMLTFGCRLQQRTSGKG